MMTMSQQKLNILYTRYYAEEQRIYVRWAHNLSWDKIVLKYHLIF
jgi:hypothetical protein